MNNVVEDTLNKLKQCDDFHNRCDCLLEHSEITYLLEYIKELNDKIEDDKMIIEGNWGCIDNLRKDYNLQKNIIKEVREKIKNKEPFYSDFYDREIILFDEEDKNEFLEILDKAYKE